MMYSLLKVVRTLPLRKEYVSRFLHAAALLVELDVLTIDNWKYLTHLLMFRVHKVMSIK